MEVFEGEWWGRDETHLFAILRNSASGSKARSQCLKVRNLLSLKSRSPIQDVRTILNQARQMRKLVSKLRTLRSSSGPTFHILSDLHLVVGQQYSTFQIPVSAPFLILAGDIGRFIDYSSYLEFLKIQCSRFVKVFLVPGNHEFYETSHEDGLALARKREADLDGKLVLCHQQRFDVPDSDVIILGYSLWSHIPNDAQDVVRMKVSDFKKIKDWSVEAHNDAYRSDLEWLRAEIEALRHEQNAPTDDDHDEQTARKRNWSSSNGSQSKPKKLQILIITHYAPCKDGNSEPRFAANPWNSAFATDLITKGHARQDVKLWIFGHTHYSTEFVKEGIRVLSNQRGYILPGPKRKDPEGYGKGAWRAFDTHKVVSL